MASPLIPPSRVYQSRHLDSTRWTPYAPRDDDIVISTSYKSGTTWMQSIVRELIVHAMEQAGVDDPNLFPQPDLLSSPWIDRRQADLLDQFYAKFEAQSHRRFFKSHVARDGIPVYSQVSYVVVGRDPRDVFLSLWNHYSLTTDAAYQRLNNIPGYDGPPFPRCPDDIHEFWTMWISRGWFEWEQEGYPYWGNMSHTQSWWDYRHLDNVLLLHYGDMLANPSAAVRRVARFLAVELSDEALAQVVRHTSFDAMRQRALVWEAEGQQRYPGGASNFFHRGKNGRWRDVLTAVELEQYEQKKAAVLEPDCAQWLEQGESALSAATPGTQTA